MSPRRWIRRQLDRPIAGHEHRTATVCVLLLVVAVAGLILTAPSRPVEAPENSHTKLTIHTSSAPPLEWTPENAADAKDAAETFLGAYLAFLYGQAPASTIDTTAAFGRSLQQAPHRVPPGIGELHPRVVSLQVSAHGSSEALALALVSDGEVVHYPIRLVLTDGGGRWLVSGLGSAP